MAPGDLGPDWAPDIPCIDLRDGSNPGLTVAVVGLGYVGLPTALAFRAAGCRVVGFDVSQDRLNSIAVGAVDLIPADHARLEEMGGDIELTLDPARLRVADAVIICVPTPVDRHAVPDHSHVRNACTVVVEQTQPGQVIVLSSTTSVGTTSDMLVEPLRRRGLIAGQDVFVAFSPERIDPGNTNFPVERVPRVVGGATSACAGRAAKVLAEVAPTVHKVSSLEAAEMTKLVENVFRAVNISLANELADVSSALGLSVSEVIEAAATKPYGFMRFNPGPGAGGHCIPCDPHYLLWQMREHHQTTPLITAAMDALAGRPRKVVDRAIGMLARKGVPLGGARVLVVGVAYKGGVADTRESPALEIIELMRRAGIDVQFHDHLAAVVTLRSGATIRSVDVPQGQHWDLVLLHTLHPDQSLAWAADHDVLDATYRADLPQCERV